MDEKWKKLSKKDGSCGSSSSRSHGGSGSNNKKPTFTRSFSTKSTTSSTKSPLLQRSSSTKCPLPARSFSSQKGGPSISRKCSSLAKEQKARFYIIRRCVAMLVCWHKHGDS